MHPVVIVTALVGLSFVVTACGDDQAPSPTDDPAAKAPPYRESIEAARTEKVGKVKLAGRDKPLAVGETAPSFDAFAKGKANIVVFYRGHW